MMQKIEKLNEVFDHQVFELCGPFPGKEGEDYYIPYMMNDALEDYLILENCRMVGEYIHNTELKQEMQLAEDETGYVLAVRQGEENAFTIYFESIDESVNFYQYHEIGHFWVKGQEHWRQLVYIVGTIYDKFQYLGEDSCNEKELALLPLIEFAPFRFWTPIHESLDDFYPDTYEGLQLMKELAAEVNDKEYLRWLWFYEKLPCERISRILCEKLLSPKREGLYQLIWKKVAEASEGYEKRNYNDEMTEEINKIRRSAENHLLGEGYEGAYPDYQKGNQRIFVTEEHPFTIMEWDHYNFRIQFMVSQCEKMVKHHRNSGFFKGKGRKGWIEKYESI